MILSNDILFHMKTKHVEIHIEIRIFINKDKLFLWLVIVVKRMLGLNLKRL